jgi:hypothetical protein
MTPTKRTRAKWNQTANSEQKMAENSMKKQTFDPHNAKKQPDTPKNEKTLARHAHHCRWIFGIFVGVS